MEELWSLYPAITIAPAAPIAPAWFTVAIPEMIDPNTIIINVNGGTRVKKTKQTINKINEILNKLSSLIDEKKTMKKKPIPM